MSSIPITAGAVATAVTLTDVQELARTSGLSSKERQKLHDGGLARVPVATADRLDLVADVIIKLIDQGFDARNCATVIVTHSLELNSDAAGAVVAALRVTLPGLTHPPVVLSGRPCSIIHLGIELAMRQHAKNPQRGILVLGVDIAATVGDRFFFSSAMGDAAVGLVLGPTTGQLRTVAEILACCSTWNILAGDGARSHPDDIAQFRNQNPMAIRATLAAALDAAGLNWTHLTAIVPHTPYRQMWDPVAKLCRYPRDRILDDNLSETGHLNSNDVIVHLMAAMRTGKLRNGDIAALVSPGFGGTRGCTVVRIGEMYGQS